MEIQKYCEIIEIEEQMKMFKPLTKEEHYNRVAEIEDYLKEVETAYINLFRPITEEKLYKWIAEEEPEPI